MGEQIECILVKVLVNKSRLRKLWMKWIADKPWYGYLQLMDGKILNFEMMPGVEITLGNSF